MGVHDDQGRSGSLHGLGQRVFAGPRDFFRGQERDQLGRLLRAESEVVAELLFLACMGYHQHTITVLGPPGAAPRHGVEHHLPGDYHQRRAEDHEAWKERIADRKLWDRDTHNSNAHGYRREIERLAHRAWLVGHADGVGRELQQDAVADRPGETAGVDEVVGNFSDVDARG